MKVLVTGAAGFIGGQLCHALWKRGDTVVGIDNFSYGNLDNLRFEDHDFGPDVLRMDIRDREKLPELFEKERFDVVYNIAGIAPLPDCQSDPVEAVSVNTLGLVNLLELCRRHGVKHLVQASTNAMYENEPHAVALQVPIFISAMAVTWFSERIFVASSSLYPVDTPFSMIFSFPAALSKYRSTFSGSNCTPAYPSAHRIRPQLASCP